MKFSCCERQALAIMDYKWPIFAPPDEQIIKINTMCLRCNTHWAGTENELTKYTGTEWRAYIEKSFKD